jgi:transposase-like protein
MPHSKVNRCRYRVNECHASVAPAESAAATPFFSASPFRDHQPEPAGMSGSCVTHVSSPYNRRKRFHHSVRFAVVAQRRKWSAEEKAAVVKESMMRGTVIGEVAARYGLPVTVLSRWRGRYRDDAFCFHSGWQVRVEVQKALRRISDLEQRLAETAGDSRTITGRLLLVT